MGNCINNILIVTDNLYDYVPFLSTVSNLIDLFQKCVIHPLLAQSETTKSRYYVHLQQKSFLRCMALLIPVLGNIFIGVHDFRHREYNRALAIVRENPLDLQDVGPGFQDNKDIVLVAVRGDGLALEFASENLQLDRDVVLAAVTQNGLALEFAHGILQADKEIVQAAMRQGGAAAFSLASEQFHGQWRRECRRGDKEFILGAIRRGEWWAFEHAKEELRGDREIVLAVVQKNGEMVSYASADLQDDLGVVLEAVRRRGQALQYASAKMQENREVIFAAIKQAGKKVLPWVSQQFQRERVEEFTHGDKDFILAAIRNNEWWALESAKEEIRGDREVGLAAITQSGMALEFVSEVLKDDREFVLAAVKKNGAALQYASERLRSDRGVVLAAIENNKAALRYASRAIQADQELAEIAADEWGFEDLLPEDGVYGIGQ